MRGNRFFICVAALFAAASVAFAKTATIHSVLVGDFLKDEKDVLRYQPLNMLDGDPATVYAVTVQKPDARSPLVRICFADPVEFDALSIKAGYFDARYFSLNHRIKRLSVTVRNAQTTPVNRRQFCLKDEMAAQRLDLGGTVRASEILLYVEELYEGARWQDLVISDLQFLQGNAALSVAYGTGVCAGPESESHYNRKFDAEGRLVSETVQYGKMGSKDVTFVYNEHGQLVQKTELWDEPLVTAYTYRTPDAVWPEQAQVEYNADGTVRSVVQDGKTMAFAYKDGALFSVRERSGSAETMYYYQDGRCVAEQDKSTFIYHHYENGRKAWAMCIVSAQRPNPLFEQIDYDAAGRPVRDCWVEHNSGWNYLGVETY